MLEPTERKTSGQTTDHRDFPRLHVEAKVRIAGTAPTPQETDSPAVIADLSLGGVRLSTPAQLVQGQTIGIVPFNGLLEDHPLHRILEFQVMWRRPASASDDASQCDWQEYGLAHLGSVLDVLNSWLGHLLLRQREESEILVQRREHRRMTLGEREQPLRVTSSHDAKSFDLTLLDIAPGGLLARGETDQIPLGVHLELQPEWDEQHESLTSLMGCVVDAHSHSGSTFYRVAFDPDSELDEDNLIEWAQSVGGDLGS